MLIAPLAITAAQAAGIPFRWQPPPAAEIARQFLVNLAAVPDLFGRGLSDAVEFWSMTVLIQSTVLTVGVFWLVRRAVRGPAADRRAFAVLTGLVWVGFAAGLYVVAGIPWRNWDTWWLSWSAAYIGAGWLAGADGRLSGHRAVVLSLALLVVTTHGMWSAWPAVVIVALWAAERWPSATPPAFLGGLQWCGVHAYSIYLTHIVAGQTVRHLLTLETELLVGHPLVVGTLGIGAALVAGWAFRRWVELPLGRLADGPGDGRGAAGG